MVVTIWCGSLRTWLCWRKRCPTCGRFGVEDTAAEQAPGPGARGTCGSKKWWRIWEPSLGMFCTFKASFQDLPRDQLLLCVILLKNITLPFTTAFSFPASLSLPAVEHLLIWAGISGSCGPISDQQCFLKCSALLPQTEEPSLTLLYKQQSYQGLQHLCSL